ncbi:MAG TPA: acyl-CoA thioesterase domain-containing protein [Mycobacteriales bacterium]|nr:acyl-CoA thioesterase domain-containing protein [Mycobacteriales bacterium]
MAEVSPGGEKALGRFLEMLELEQLDRDLFRGWNPPRGNKGPRPTLFGGQVAAHCLRAASLTVDPLHYPHSLHGYFLRPGKDDAHTVLRVDRIRDGRSFTTRTVVAQQDGEAIFTLTASFHREEPGGEFSTPIAADIASAEELLASQGEAQHSWETDAPFQRVEIPEFSHMANSDRPRRVMWLRPRAPIPSDDPHLHAAVLTYISDMGVVGAVRSALGRWDAHGMGASLDHSLWFHRRIRADQWLLFDVWSRSNSGSRGLGVGTLHTATGVHAMTIGQEALVRLD